RSIGTMVTSSQAGAFSQVALKRFSSTMAQTTQSA
ncbi:hypothetical protein PSYJA_46821, partial [Pseudomonas syringae pv. japonica str. M301072]